MHLQPLGRRGQRPDPHGGPFGIQKVDRPERLGRQPPQGIRPVGKKGKQPPDWTLKGLGDLYKEIRRVNQDFMKRLLTAVKGDASPNALVILNAFADAVSFTVDGKMLSDLEEMIYPRPE